MVLIKSLTFQKCAQTHAQDTSSIYNTQRHRKRWLICFPKKPYVVYLIFCSYCATTADDAAEDENDDDVEALQTG